MAGNKKTTASIYPGVDPIVDPDSEKTKNEVTLLSHQKTGFVETKKNVLN